VVKLIAGALDPDVFRSYVGQDVYYLRAFVQGYALILARLEQAEHQVLLHELIGDALREIEMHQQHAAELTIDLDAVTPLRATEDYVNHLLDVGWNGDAALTLAAMTPCMRLYAYLGEHAVADGPPAEDHPYRSWIEAYSDPGFHELTVQLESLLDELATDTPELHKVYRRSMECELAFFEAALQSHPEGPEGSG
jgi:thiaminase/transcriptional activator TenA